MASQDETNPKPVPRIDFSTPANHTFKASIEREEYASERFVRLFKDVVVFLAAITLTGIIAWLCCRAVLSSSANPDEQKWAMSILSGMVGGIVGYLVKR